MIFQRDVTANEKLYLAAEPGFSHLVIQLLIRGSGRIGADALRRAVRAASSALPGTRLRLHGKMWVATDEAPEVNRLTAYPNTDEDLTAFASHPHAFDPRAGKTCDVLWYEDADRCCVAFRALHAVMDGSGLSTFARTTFACLRGHDVESMACFAPYLTEEAALRSQGAPIRSSEPMRPTCVGPRADAKLGPSYDFDFAHMTVRGCTPAIAARLSVAVQRLLSKEGTAPGLVMMPVDLRPQLGMAANQSTANFTLPLFLKVRSEESWREVSADLLTQLQERRFMARGRNDWLYHTLPRGLLAWYLPRLWKKQQTRGRYMFSAVISHATRQPLLDYAAPGFLPHEVVPIPCAIAVSPLAVTVAEFSSPATDPQTTLCLTKARSLWGSPREVLSRLLDIAGLGGRVIEPHTARTHDNPSAASQTRRGLDPTPPDPVPQVSAPALHRLFEQQVDRTPQAPCCTFRDETWSYERLDAEANRLAHHLHANGLKIGDVVGVGLERSLALPAAILAIMKAGGVYVPLDPTTAPARLHYMVNDSAATCVITHSAHRKLFAQARTCVYVDIDAQSIGEQPKTRPPVEVGPHDLCTLMYTSGSTGRPKGALNRHAALCNHFEWMRDELGLTSADVSLQKTPIGFDASLLEVFLPLDSGAQSFIVEPGAHADALHLANEIRRRGVTFLSITPSLLRAVVDEMQDPARSDLRCLLVGGEAFPRGLYEKLRSGFESARIYNLYGPAECAIDAITYCASGPIETDTVPIGRPIANVDVYVVDADLQPVAPGQTGELLLGGMAVGAGYVGDPALNAERFLDSPFRHHKDAKLYRTGDRVRQLPDGALLYLGRIDNQIKIAGVRIEVEEIEHHMAQIPFVRQAVVTVREVRRADGELRQVLVAYYSVEGERELPADTSRELRQALRRFLPEIMIPSTFNRIDDFVLNANGKIDRRALAAQPSNRSFCLAPADETMAEPHCATEWSAAEAELATLWADALGVSPDHATDFFAVGGDSMLAIALIRRVNARFGSTLHPQCLYENATFSEFSQLVHSAPLDLLKHNGCPQTGFRSSP